MPSGSGEGTAVGDRLAPVEWVLLAILALAPAALTWHFASPSYFFEDDLRNIYWAHTGEASLSYAFAGDIGPMVPGPRMLYLALDRVAPMNFEVALAFLVACKAVAAVLLQRILALLFGSAWWTYALALAWGISVVYLPSLAWVAAGINSIPAIPATLASIHGYLCWRATGRRIWLVWSLVAMCVGLAFYVKVLLVPLYLLLMRVLLLDPAARLRDSLRSVREEWPVWLAYGTVCAAYLTVYLLGDYQSTDTETLTVGEVLRSLRVFWFEGFWPLVFGLRVPPYEQQDWHQVLIVAAQLAVLGLVAWSVARRRAAWRAWAFLIVTLALNMLMVGAARIAYYGPDAVAFNVRYYTEPALLVPLAIAFAFAQPRLRRSVSVAQPWESESAPATGAERFGLPTAPVGTAALVALVIYAGVTTATASIASDRESALPEPLSAEHDGLRYDGRNARVYFERLRAELAATRHSGGQFSLLDGDVPETAISSFMNLDTPRTGVRYTLLSTLMPLFEEHVPFNQSGRLYIVRPDGQLERTRFVPAAGGSLAELRRAGRLRIRRARVERRGGESCLLAGGHGAVLEWEPRPHLLGRDWWLRVRYRTAPGRPIGLQSNAGFEWVEEAFGFPAMAASGTRVASLAELPPPSVPSNAGVRLGVPPLGRLCLGSLEIGSFHPPTPS